MTFRSPRTIALAIEADYASRDKDVPAPAMAYLEPAYYLDSWDSMFGADDAVTVMIYLLSNLGGWRGETAKAVKLEIKEGLRAKGLKV